MVAAARGAPTPQQRDQRVGVSITVVDIGDQHTRHRDLPAGRAYVTVEAVEHLLRRIAVMQRDQAPAHVAVRRMQRESDAHSWVAGQQAVQARQHAHCRHRDPAWPVREQRRIDQHVDGLDHVRVGEWFAHPHEGHTTDMVTTLAEPQHLIGDLVDA